MSATSVNDASGDRAVPARFKTDTFTSKLKTAALKTQASLPTAEELTTLSKEVQDYFRSLSALTKEVLSTSEWNDTAINHLAQQADWAHTSGQLAARLSERPGPSPSDRKGGGGPGTTQTCSDVYDGCMKTSDCHYSFPCICCLPCEFEMAACWKKIWVGKGTPYTPLIDLNGTWASGGIPGPVISFDGTTLTVDMSAYKRPTATGYLTDNSDIIVDFTDDKVYTGMLHQPNTINWSNHSAWTKVVH